MKLTYTRCDYKEIIIGYVDSDWGGNDCNVDVVPLVIYLSYLTIVQFVGIQEGKRQWQLLPLRLCLRQSEKRCG